MSGGYTDVSCEQTMMCGTPAPVTAKGKTNAGIGSNDTRKQ